MTKDTKNTQKKGANKGNTKEVNKNVKKGVKKENNAVNESVKEEKVIESEKKVVEKKEKVENNKEIKNNEKLIATLNKIDDNRKGIILFVIGFLIATLLFRCIFWPDRIATLKDGTQPIVNFSDKVITADDLYAEMKEYYSVKVLLNTVDNMILSEKYPENDEMKKEIQTTADYYYSIYEQNYGYTKEKFLNEYGFASEDDFLDSLTLDYHRNKYYEDYALSLVDEKEINKYYENDVFGDVDSKHILVSVKSDNNEDGLTDDEAKKIAKEIIDKLNNGTSWDDVINEYEDKIIHEELGYQAFNASLESAYLKECKNLEVDSYSKEPVLTSYGYHIVYKIAQKDKPELKDVEDTIKELLADSKKNDDTNLYYKALIKMREEAKMEFADTKLKEEYEKYINAYK